MGAIWQIQLNDIHLVLMSAVSTISEAACLNCFKNFKSLPAAVKILAVISAFCSPCTDGFVALLTIE